MNIRWEKNAIFDFNFLYKPHQSPTDLNTDTETDYFVGWTDTQITTSLYISCRNHLNEMYVEVHVMTVC